MQHDPADISNNLNKETADHADRESPGLALDAEPELHDQKQAKGRSIDSIASERRYVLHLSAAEWTCSHGAVDSALERTRVWHFGCKIGNRTI
jgi:hypothetical protein